MIMADQLRAACPLRLVRGDECGGVNFKRCRGRIGDIGAGLRRVDALRRSEQQPAHLNIGRFCGVSADRGDGFA